jgi:hypothetical protein
MEVQMATKGNFLVGLAEFLGLFNKAQAWLQGKKTNIAGAVMLCGALSALFLGVGQGFDVLGQMLGQVLLVAEGSLKVSQLYPAIAQIAEAHKDLLNAFGAAWASILFSIQMMAKHAQSARVEKKITAQIAQVTETTRGGDHA